MNHAKKVERVRNIFSELAAIYSRGGMPNGQMWGLDTWGKLHDLADAIADTAGCKVVQKNGDEP